MQENKLGFTVDSHLLSELGERLVTRNYIALSELVKNAYDADATKIIIRFINARRGGTKRGNSAIHLVDNGHGMTFEQVRDYWMRVATPHKIREPISPIFGRRKTGSKGIGRFACRRLAKRLVIETIAKLPNAKTLEWTKVEFDWNKFESGTTLTEIPCGYQRRELNEGMPGLTLKLTDLTEPWSEGEFNLLRRQVLTLSVVQGTRRKGFEEDPGFEIDLQAPEFPSGAGIMVDQFMDAGWGKLEGFVKENEIVALKSTAKEIGTRNYTLPEKFKALKGITFEIAWIPARKEYFRDTRTLTKGLAEATREQGGVRVYLDGFRIYPYGDLGDDWLGIDRDIARRWGTADRIFEGVASGLGVDPTRAMLNHPQNRHLIGRVYISSRPGMPFVVKADREGFVKNDAYEDLIKCIRLALQWFTLHYNKFLLLHASAEAKKAEEELRMKLGEVREEKFGIREIPSPLVEKAVNLLSMEAKRAFETLPEKEKKESEERVEAATKVIQRSFTRAETYLSMLRSVASTGALMFVFSHEIKVLIARLDTHARTLGRIIETLPVKKRTEFRQFAQSLHDTRDRFDQQVKLFGILAQKTADTQRKMLSVKDACTEVLQGFEYLVKHYGLNQVKIDVPDSLRTGPMLDAELFSIIINLVSNAIKAILSGHGKNVLIQGRKEHGKAVIRVFDDGVGLSKNFREEVFEPLTADPDGRLYEGLRKRIPDEDLAALGRGSGLGLSIVRGIVESYGGKAYFTNVNPPWKTCIEVVLP